MKNLHFERFSEDQNWNSVQFLFSVYRHYWGKQTINSIRDIKNLDLSGFPVLVPLCKISALHFSTEGLV